VDGRRVTSAVCNGTPNPAFQFIVKSPGVPIDKPTAATKPKLTSVAVATEKEVSPIISLLSLGREPGIRGEWLGASPVRLNEALWTNQLFTPLIETMISPVIGSYWARASPGRAGPGSEVVLN